MKFFHNSGSYAPGWMPIKIYDIEREELKRWFEEEHPDHKIQSFEDNIYLETKEDTGIIFERREESCGNSLLYFLFFISLALNAALVSGLISIG